MSLLMDALKKAEKAKQGAGGVLGEPTTPPPSATGPVTEWPVLSLDPRPVDLDAELGLTPVAAAAPAKRVESPPRALALDPIPAPAASTPAPPGPLPDSEPPVKPRPQAENRAAGDRLATTPDLDRRTAKGVFSAKQSGTSAGGSRTPFYWTVGLLLACGAGAAIYVWSELQPANTPVARPPVPTSAGTINKAPTAATPGQAPQSSPPAALTTVAPPSAPSASTVADGPRIQPQPPAPSPSPPSSAAQPGAPPPASAAPNRQPDMASIDAAPAKPSPRQYDAPMVVKSSPAAPRRDTESAAQAQSTASARGGIPVAAPANLRISRDRPSAQVDPAVAAGYAALAEGNLALARENYNRALEADSTSRDALLGLAAVASRSGRGDVAENLYQRVLELHPRDSYAIAQLTTLRNGGDTAGSESRVKALLANEREPAGAAPLHFALGNQMAAQGRWPEAQQAYFNAYSAEPDNPDYCYNLAVSLDHMHQTRLAHEHYAKAIALADKRRAGFDPARARARLEQLANAAR